MTTTANQDLVKFRTPALFWWIVIPLGLTVNGMFAFGVPIPGFLLALGITARVAKIIFLLAWAIHLGEAMYAIYLVFPYCSPPDALKWHLQTILLGGASLALIKRRVRSIEMKRAKQ